MFAEAGARWGKPQRAVKQSRKKANQADSGARAPAAGRRAVGRTGKAV